MIHVIDTVLTVPPNIVVTANATSLTALLELVGGVGLAPTLLEAIDITVFAPTNAAFQTALGGKELPDATTLRNLLGAHGKSFDRHAADQD